MRFLGLGCLIRGRSLATLASCAAAGLLGISQPISAADGKFVNLSTRALVEAGDEVMIGGFIISEGSRQVLVQAVGPELANAGISNALADPVLTVTNTTDPGNPIELMVNDNWEDSQEQLIIDLWGGSPPLAAGSQSSAAVLTLDPGNYTAKVEGKDGTAGISIVEVFGIDSAGADGKFVNLSTRALVGTGEEVMIGGFIIDGGARQVLVQAVGPELANAGISNALADPILTVTNTTDPGNPIELMVNDNWEDSQGQLVSDLWGGNPTLTAGSLSSAAVLTLEPGGYTAKVEGKDGTAGVAIVEMYEVDSPAQVDWVFAGNVPEAHQTVLREEMEVVRTWFTERYGVEASGFTVLVGADSEALTPVFNEVVRPGPLPYSPLGISVATAENGSAVILVDFSGGVSSHGEQAITTVRNSIIHEYFHVLQGQLASGFQQVSASKLAYDLGQGPFWLVEGLAQYADYLYTQSRPGRPSFLDHNTPHNRLADAIGQGALTFGDLVNLEDQGNLQGGLAHPLFTYPMAFLASTLLVDLADKQGSFVNYWQLLHDRPTWQQAFEEAFGIGIGDFYETFEEWLPSQLPLKAYLSVFLRWPGRDALASDALNRILWKTTVVPEFTSDHPGGIVNWGGTSADGANIISYSSGTTARAYLSLQWELDGCTDYILGWYKDGELTDQKGEATMVEFSGTSSSLEWELPEQPENLPRLSQVSLPNCTP